MENNQKDLSSQELKNSQKVDLHISHANDEDEGALNLLNIFSNMKKRRKIYVWVLILSFLIGTIAPFMLYQKAKTNPSAVALLTLDYDGVEEGKAPDGTTLSVSSLKSISLLNEAIESVSLSKTVTASSLASALTVNGVLTEEAQKQIKKIEDLASKDESYSSLYQALNLEYRGQYILTLKNNFDLTATEISHLLTAICNAFSGYFYSTYKADLLPKSTIETLDFASLDYLESLDELKDALTYLQTYCTNLAKSCPTYRGFDGLTFTDLKNVAIEKEATINYLYSYVATNNITKDADALELTYEFELREVESQIAEVEKKLSSVNSSIANYKADKVVIATGEGGEEQTATFTTDAYNELILEQVELNEKKSQLEKEKAILTDKISQLATEPATESEIAKAEADITEAITSVKSLYTLAKSYAGNLLSASEYQNAMVYSIVTVTSATSLRSYAKKIVIGMLAGLFIGFCAWGVDGLVLEIKDSKKREEERA